MLRPSTVSKRLIDAGFLMRALSNFKNTRHLLVVDALRYALLIEQRAFASLRRALRRIETLNTVKRRPSEAVALTALTAAWTMVDTVHRARDMVRQVPSLSQKKPDVQLFVRNSQEVGTFRDLYQHLNTEIPKMAGKANPVMGVLSWVTKDPRKSITIFVGTGAQDLELHTVVFDTWKNEFVQSTLFSAGNRDINLESLHEDCRRFRRFFDEWLAENNHLSSEELSVGIVRFQSALAK